MAKAYLVSYDLNAPGQKYDDLSEAIKNCSTYNIWIKLLSTTWLIKSSYSTNEICSKLKPFIDKNDRILVIEIADNYQGWLTDDDWNYINNSIF